jgi:hypothetical protein
MVENNIADEVYEKLLRKLLTEITPPWWEKWALIGSFCLGVAVGIFVGEMFFT